MISLLRISIAAGMLFLAGCATTAPQSVAILRAPPHLPTQFEIKGVPFVDQSAGQCGPATLTMAMQWAGHPATIDQILPMVMTPGKKGSLQEDLISASRREGLMAVPIEGMDSMMQELADGHPVIIFENLALTWYTQWHYALVYGYDLKNQEFIMNSGHDEGERDDMKIFERSWKLSDYWGLVVLQPGEIVKSASELANLQAAAGLEQAGHDLEATRAYLAILEKWPTSLGALIGLGNTSYKQHDFTSAVSYLREAQKAHPESKTVEHNLKVAEAAAESRTL